MKKTLSIALAAMLWSATATAADVETATADNNSEFQAEDVLEEGFLTGYLNRAIATSMAPSAAAPQGGAEEMTYGRNVSKWASAPKFGGFVIGSYKYSDQEGANNGPGFAIRLARVYVDGTLLRDFKYRLQVELNGTPHVKDFFLDWQRWKEFGIKVGQYKRSFTFENPYNPWLVGVGDYSQLTKKLAGMGDYNGEASMGGRDQGIQLHGDVLPIGTDRHRLFHYEIGLYNGQGINSADKNKRKDVIGTLQVQPIKDLFIGFFGWTGNAVINGLTVDRNRYALGVKYEHEGWSARAEYAHSQGKAVKSRAGQKYVVTDNAGVEHTMQDATTYYIDESNDRADAWYATVGVPVTSWLKVYGKYDAYRSTACNSSLRSIYSLAPNFQLHKNLMLQLQYNYVHDKTAADRSHNELWVQTYFRF